MATNDLRKYFVQPVHLAPLAVFRMAFGVLMLASTIRFIARGWVHSMYVKPTFFFTYYGFEWVRPFSENTMYVLFGLMALSALFIALGLFYRISAIFFFLSFTYVELIDKTNYLNHYYFISIAALLMIFIPAHRYFSVDVLRNKKLYASHAPNYFILLIKFQVFIVYFFAGVAKINHDWLFEAMPLRIWLPAQNDLPLIGPLLSKTWVAYFFSWFGCIYDLCIPFFLFNKRLIRPAYVFVIVFHLATWFLFNIGMFPFIMIALTTIFFSESFHKRLIETLRSLVGRKHNFELKKVFVPQRAFINLFAALFILHFSIQLFLPLRYLLYPGKLFWTEQGFRFSWRVMLMEKAGTAFFYVREKGSDRETEISNCDYLTAMQEKMMATQPDMILQYAQFLKQEYRNKGFINPEVRAESYVTLNGRASKLMIDKQTILSDQEESFANKNWILPYTK